MTRFLLTYLSPLWRRVFWLAVSLFAGIGLTVVNPQLLRRFIDAVQRGGSETKLLSIAALFLILALLQQVLRLATGLLSEDVGWRATNRLRHDLAAHCLRLPMVFHLQQTPGALIERVDGDVELLASYFSRLVLELVGNLLLVIVIITLLFREWWVFGAVVCIYVASFALLYRIMRPAAVRLNRDDRQVDADLFGFLEEVLVSKEDLRAAGAEDYVMARLSLIMRRALSVAYRMAAIVGILFNGGRLLLILTAALVLFLGAARLRQGAMSLGTLFLAAYYVELLERPMNRIRRHTTGLYAAAASLLRVRELLNEPVQHANAHEPDRPQRVRGPCTVTFEHVSFSYDSRRNTLHDVNLSLAPGEILGLLGRTGSGKTTLSRLLFRLYHPTSGSIYLDGVPLAQYTLKTVRQRVALVTQDVQLFAGSVRDNVTFFGTRFSDGQIIAALGELGLLSWLRRLPEGLDTKLSSGGHGLSAGQAQLLAFTRVYLRDPGLIVLDEASSRLDPETETLLEDAMARLLAGRTAIIIAHRLQTLARADKILVLEKGTVIEYGRRAALASDPLSRFTRYVQAGRGKRDE